MWLAEGLGTRVPSRETDRQWANAIKNGWEETDDAANSGALPMATND